jgi:hypothetical protein
LIQDLYRHVYVYVCIFTFIGNESDGVFWPVFRGRHASSAMAILGMVWIMVGPYCIQWITSCHGFVSWPRFLLPVMNQRSLQSSSSLLSRWVPTTTTPRYAHSNNLDDLLNEVLNSATTEHLPREKQESQGGVSATITTTTAATTTATTTENGWKRIYWNSSELERNVQKLILPPSPVDIVMIRDRLVYMKRDDQVMCEKVGFVTQPRWSPFP